MPKEREVTFLVGKNGVKEVVPKGEELAPVDRSVGMDYKSSGAKRGKLAPVGRNVIISHESSGVKRRGIGTSGQKHGYRL